jgi:hypothetical protein
MAWTDTSHMWFSLTDSLIELVVHVPIMIDFIR